MVTWYLVLLAISLGHLISILEIVHPITITPSTHYPWSPQEPFSSLTSQSQSEIDSHLSFLYTHYNDLLNSDSPDAVIYTKPSEIGQQIAEAYKASLKIPSSIHSKNITEDFLLSPETACKRIYWLQIRDRLDSKAFTSYWSDVEPFIEKFSEIIQENATIHKLSSLGEAILSYRKREIPIVSSITPELQEIAITAYKRNIDLLIYGSKEQGKLATNAFFFDILTKMSSTDLAEVYFFLPDPALFHAITKMLAFEGINNTMTIEIHYDKERYIIFKSLEENLDSSWCGGKCTWDALKKVLEKRMYKNTKAHLYACEVVGDAPSGWRDYIIYGGGVFAILLLFMCNTKAALWVAKKFKTKAD